jgi:hypothetical protein
MELPKYEKRAAAYTTAVADMVKVRLACVRVRLGWADGVGRVCLLCGCPSGHHFGPSSSLHYYPHTWLSVNKWTGCGLTIRFHCDLLLSTDSQHTTQCSAPLHLPSLCVAVTVAGVCRSTPSLTPSRSKWAIDALTKGTLQSTRSSFTFLCDNTHSRWSTPTEIPTCFVRWPLPQNQHQYQSSNHPVAAAAVGPRPGPDLRVLGRCIDSLVWFLRLASKSIRLPLSGSHLTLSASHSRLC